VIVQIDTTRSILHPQHPHHRGIKRADIVLVQLNRQDLVFFEEFPRAACQISKAFVLTVLHTEEVSLGYEYQLFLGTHTVHQLGANMVRSQSQFLDLGEPRRKTEFPDLAPQFSEVEAYGAIGMFHCLQQSANNCFWTRF